MCGVPRTESKSRTSHRQHACDEVRSERGEKLRIADYRVEGVGAGDRNLNLHHTATV